MLETLLFSRWDDKVTEQEERRYTENHSAWRRLSWGLSNYPVLNHNCKLYPIKRHLPSHPLKLHQPQAFNNCGLGRQSGLMISPSDGNLPSPHTQGSESRCGNPFNCLIIVLSSSMDSITNSPHAAQSKSECSV